MVKRYPLPTVRALAPRFGAGSLFYLSSLGGGDGLWRFRDSQALEIWRGIEAPLFDPAAISTDGKRVAIAVRRHGKIQLEVTNDDGTGAVTLSESLDVRGAGSWSPDGRWIAIGGTDAKGPGLFKIRAEGGPPVPADRERRL
jgi:WD40-like Beta Propeller Repeat